MSWDSVSFTTTSNPALSFRFSLHTTFFIILLPSQHTRKLLPVTHAHSSSMFVFQSNDYIGLLLIHSGLTNYKPWVFLKCQGGLWNGTAFRHNIRAVWPSFHPVTVGGGNYEGALLKGDHAQSPSLKPPASSQIKIRFKFNYIGLSVPNDFNFFL